MMRIFFFLLLVSSSAFGQKLLEASLIDEETGNPIPFASIGIVGTSKGTSSNLNGEFSLSVDNPSLIQITCIGYESIQINSDEVGKTILLKPIITQLQDIVVFSKPVNSKKIIRKAFANISDNYNNQSFLQKFFYRHYCKDDDTYGRLVEAFVDVWKDKGYKSFQRKAGEKESIRITHLRRSLDNTVMAQSHEPISVSNILETDIVGYQSSESNGGLSFYTNVSNLKTDFSRYSFNYNGITSYDGKEVYKIGYVYQYDSALTTSGNYLIGPKATGTLFITTDTYAIIKMEEVKTYGQNTTRTTTYYRKHSDKYYPYHFILEGENQATDNSQHAFHIELISVEVKESLEEKFMGSLPSREELLNIPYDSVFWATNTLLKTTPMEDEIIRDLGGGLSLTKQFIRYKQHELNVNNGGVNGEEKLKWFINDSQGNRVLYLVFWSNHFQNYLRELEMAKQLNKQYRNKITFVFVSLDDDQERWQQTIQRFNFFSDGIIQYRIGGNSSIAKSFMIKNIPSFTLISKNGEFYDLKAKQPSDNALLKDFELLIEKEL